MGMSPGVCFGTFIKRRKAKGNGDNHEKVDEDASFSSRRYQINRESSTSRLPRRRSLEDIAATRIQAAFRAHRARKLLRGLKGAVRFQDLIHGNTAREQASSALGFIHSWSRLQQEITARRLCMVTEYRIKQKKQENQLKLEAKLHELEVEWCGGSETMEEILCRIQQREEAAARRERAMAYAFSHQWRASSIPYLTPASFSLGKENWGWSWKERWIAARPWEIRARVHPTIPKKVQPKNGSKSDKLTCQPELNLSVLPKSAAPNGEGTTKFRKHSPPDS